MKCVTKKEMGFCTTFLSGFKTNTSRCPHCNNDIVGLTSRHFFEKIEQKNHVYSTTTYQMQIGNSFLSGTKSYTLYFDVNNYTLEYYNYIHSENKVMKVNHALSDELSYDKKSMQKAKNGYFELNELSEQIAYKFIAYVIYELRKNTQTEFDSILLKNTYPYLIETKAKILFREENIFSKVNSITELTNMLFGKSKKSVKRAWYWLIEKDYAFPIIIEDILHLNRLFEDCNILKEAIANYFLLEKSVLTNAYFTFLKQIMSVKSERWLLDRLYEDAIDTSTFFDIHWMWNICVNINGADFSKLKFRSFLQLEDVLIECINNEEMEKEYENCTFVYKTDVLKLEGSYKGFDFSLPRDSQELQEWGKSQKNCLLTRHDSIVRGDSIILKVFKERREYGSIEIKADGTLIEARKKSNRDFSVDEMVFIKNYIEQKLSSIGSSSELSNIFDKM
ncbi:MAG: hypothetical protein KU37_07970 [Sulfuricurvum sp. PC08-66]|nr:MAG: hypothetical protein KU37_07970 [Sulfuricurvum sp. PC08-66]